MKIIINILFNLILIQKLFTKIFR